VGERGEEKMSGQLYIANAFSIQMPRNDGVRRPEEVDFEEEATDEGRDGIS
jgi:hypothetical protein